MNTNSLTKLVLAFILLGGVRALLAGPPEVETNCEALAVKTTELPVIDGAVDEVWANAPEYPIAEWLEATGTTPPASENELSGQWRALWTEQYLFVLMEVKTTWDIWAAHNAVEIYSSVMYTRQYGVYGNSGYNGTSDYQLQWGYGNPMTASPAVEFGLYSFKPTSNSITAKVVKTAHGYIFEGRLPWVDLGGEDGHGLDAIRTNEQVDANGRLYMGWDIHLQGSPGDKPQTIIGWCGGPPDRKVDMGWVDTSIWGTLWLVESTPPASIFVPPQTTVFAGGWKWNPPLGFFHDAYPFLYSLNTNGWCWVFPQGASQTGTGFFLYDFQRPGWGWTVADETMGGSIFYF